MAFTEINLAEIEVGKPITAQLLLKIKDSLDDLDIRLGAADVQTITANNTLTAGALSIIQLGDTTAGNITTILPTATSSQGVIYIFKKISSDANTFTIDGAGAETVEDAATWVLSRQYDSVAITSDGTEWFITNKIDTTNLVTSTRTISTTSPLTGGGNLSANRTFAIGTNTITNTYINSAASIAYSKLNLATSIVNADVSASAAIAYSKLNLTSSIVNADISASAAIAYSKLNLTGTIVNADVNASAAIAQSKLAALTASKAVVTNGSGYLTTSATTATEIGYLSGISSNLQTQIDGKFASAGNLIQAPINHASWYNGSPSVAITNAVVSLGIIGSLCEITLNINATATQYGTFLLLMSYTASGVGSVAKVSFTGDTTSFGALGANVTFTMSSGSLKYQFSVASPAGFTSTDIYHRTFYVG